MSREIIQTPNPIQDTRDAYTGDIMNTAMLSIVGSQTTAMEHSAKTNWAFRLQLLVLVIIPFIAAVTYFGFIASGRYVSSTQIVIQSAEMSTTSGIAGMLNTVSPLGGTGSQGDILVSYIHSANILGKLENLLSLKIIFSPEFVDDLSILSGDASDETFLDYYRNKVLVEWDASTSLLSIDVEAFTPNDAKLILDTIIMLSEEKLNSLSDRKQKDRVAFAKNELKLAEIRLLNARLAVADFRRKYGEIDPLQSAKATGALLASIQSRLSEAQAELSALLYVMKPTSTQVQSVRAQINALKTQIKIEKLKATDSNSGGQDVVLSDLVSQFEGLILEEEFSRTTYTSALSFFETTRAQAQQDSSYVVDFIPANLPDEALQPRRFQIILSVLVVSLLVLGIGKLIVAAIKEQARL